MDQCVDTWQVVSQERGRKVKILTVESKQVTSTTVTPNTSSENGVLKPLFSIAPQELALRASFFDNQSRRTAGD